MKTIYEQYYEIEFHSDADGSVNERIWKYTDPVVIVKKFTWYNKKQFVSGLYKDYLEYNYSDEYGSEPSLAIVDKAFYTIKDNTYIGNLDGVISYLYLQENPDDLKKYKRIMSPTYQQFADYMIRKDLFIMHRLRKTTNSDWPDYALAYYYSEDNTGIWFEFLDTYSGPTDSVDIFAKENISD